MNWEEIDDKMLRTELIKTRDNINQGIPWQPVNINSGNGILEDRLMCYNFMFDW